MSDSDLEIPDFLRIPASARAAGWRDHPPQPTQSFGREMSETERLYRESIEYDKAVKRELDRPRFAAMRARAAAEKAELEAVRIAAAKANPRRRRRA